MTLTVLGVERVRAYRESKRWLMPARETLNTWLFAASAAIQSIVRSIQEAGEPLREWPEGTELADVILALTQRRPDALRAVAATVREEAGRVGVAATGAVAVIARVRGLEGAVQMMFAAQRRFDQVAELCDGLAWLNPAVKPEGEQRGLPIARKHAAAILPLLNESNDDLLHLRSYVMETRDRVAAAHT